jgi:hypothetical protein
MCGACSTHGRGERILVGKPEGKRPVERLVHRWEDNIKIVRREIGWEGVDWIHLSQDREHLQGVLSMVMNLQVP